MTDKRFLSRGIDYLGAVSAKLRDLQGYDTLIHELIQNADDAKSATRMVFDVCDEALIVENDGVFSDCGRVEEPDCPWKEEKGHRCDFHRFRIVVSGDKRAEESTTGAFGIGFIAVYQITDRPELISAGRHWILHEDRLENERIEVCGGCAKCQAPDLPGTRFIFPLARDPHTNLRKRLQVEPVPQDFGEQMLQVLQKCLPTSMIFLKRLDTIEVKKNGIHVVTFERLKEGDSLIVSDGDHDHIYHILCDSFTDVAESLKRQHTGRIEPKRSAEVTIAIPQTDEPGLLCATLPTEHSLGLPFHINADFFTTNDRKRVIFEQDYQSQWNREALKTAAQAIGANLTRLRDLLRARRFWDLMNCLYKAKSQHIEHVEGLEEFWEQVEPGLQAHEVIYTTDGFWVTVKEVYLLRDLEEESIIPVLKGLGIQLVHEDLRPFWNLLTLLGVKVLDLEALCERLEAVGLTQRTECSNLPDFLSVSSHREALWNEIVRLLQRTGKTKTGEYRDRLSHLAIAPGRDDALWPCGEIYRADEATVELFEALGFDVPFLQTTEAFRPLEDLCPEFSVREAIDTIEQIERKALNELWRRGDLAELFNWFVSREKEIKSDEDLRKSLAALPLYPSSSGLHPLAKLSLPGGFKDPLGLAEVVDLEALGGHENFLRMLGMRELTFEEYVVHRLPAALKDPGRPDPKKRREVVLLLARRQNDLKELPGAQDALKNTPLVECVDGIFRLACQCYFDVPVVRECLGDNAHIAKLPQERREAVQDLYRWLGVAEEPRLADIVDIVRKLAQQPFSQMAKERVVKIVAYLGKRYSPKPDAPNALSSLKHLRWLPARDRTDRWYAPNELYTVFRSHIFESQGLFVDIPQDVQKRSSEFLKFLGVRSDPSPELVVKHLLHCSKQAKEVHTDVYRFLNDHADDPCVRSLKNEKCLWLGQGYYSPSQVFWGRHPFGRYRVQLTDELAAFRKLLGALGVRESPYCRDALEVLKQISREFGKSNKPLDDEAYSVLMKCWQMLQNALEESLISDKTIREVLGELKCVPRSDRVLERPDWMFFENRAGLGEKFGNFLKNNLIRYPAGAGKAMEAAGVRWLSSAVEVELVDCGQPEEDSIVAQRVRERRNEIARVVNQAMNGSDLQRILKQLTRIQIQRSNLLKIRYRLHAFNRERYSEEETPSAVYDRNGVRLIFIPRNGEIPWPSIARELAIALYPKEDPGKFAAGLKEVLAAPTADQARSSLDELGLPPLEVPEYEIPEPVQSPATLGVDTEFDESTLKETNVVAAAPKSTLTTEPQNMDVDVQKALKALGIAHQLKAPLHLSESPEAKRKEDTRAGSMDFSSSESQEIFTKSEPSGAARGSGRRQFISYVGVHPKDPQPGITDADYEANRELEAQAIEFILSREPQWQRAPANNPGYDLFQVGPDGDEKKWCEVKAMRDSLEERPVSMTRTQFEFAQRHGKNYWLYIVEYTGTEQQRLLRIQDPAGKAQSFTFDHGWRAAAETEHHEEFGE